MRQATRDQHVKSHLGSCRTPTSGSQRSFLFLFFLLSFLGTVVFNSFRKKVRQRSLKSITAERLTTALF